MVTVRQLLELMDEDDLVYIINNETEDDEFGGSVKKCKESIPELLDYDVVRCYSSTDGGFCLYRGDRCLYRTVYDWESKRK